MAKALKIKAKRNGYRRAGHGFSDKEEKYILLDALKKEQIEALTSDDGLIVSEVDYDPEAEAKAAAKAAKEEPKK
jgi:hypothetical protein